MFKILMLSKITIILTTSVNNTNNAHANDLANNFFFFLKKQYIRLLDQPEETRKARFGK